MPSYIVKIKPDHDLYVYWSTIVEGPIAIGTRTELADYLRTRAHHVSAELAAPERFDRADNTGTSSIDRFYDWSNEGFIVEQYGTVKRSDIPELMRCMAERIDYAHLLTPFEDDDA